MNPRTNSVRFVTWRGYPWSAEMLIACLGSTMAVLGVVYPTLLGIALACWVLTLAALRVNWLLYVIVFCLPVAPLLDTDFAIRDVSTLLRLALFAGVGIACIAGRPRLCEWISGTRINVAILIYALIVLLSTLAFNQPSLSSQHAVLRLSGYLALYFAVVGWVKNSKQLGMLINIVVLSTIAVSLFGMYQAAIDDYGALYFRLYPLQEEGVQPWEGRVSSFLFHFNSLAGYLNLVLPFCLALLATSKGFRRPAAICLVLGTATLLLTQSRGGLIAFAGTILLGIWFLVRNKRLRLWLLGLFPVSLLIAIPVLSLYAERLSRVDEFTTASRLMIFSAAWIMFLSSPLIGVGYGNFRELYASIIPGPGGIVDSHNLYLQLLSETGILGLIAFLAVVIAMLTLAVRQLYRAQTPLDSIVGFGSLAAIVSVLVHGFVDFLFITSPQFGALFWLVLAVLVANERLRTPPATASAA